jgi:predicted DNA binding CopG/RHH family protein
MKTNRVLKRLRSGTKVAKVTISIPHEVLHVVKQHAQKDGRSLSNYITQRLQACALS